MNPSGSAMCRSIQRSAATLVMEKCSQTKLSDSSSNRPASQAAASSAPTAAAGWPGVNR
jgi:hypothetical protein